MATFDQRKFQFFKEREERSILIKIRLKLHEISTEVLLEVFSTCGNIETVENFRSGEEFHSKVCFEDQDSTMRALDWYNGWCIYGSCCQLELFQASQVIDRSSKIKVPTPEVEDACLEIPAMPEIGEGDDIQIAQDSPRSFDQRFEEVAEIVRGDPKSELREVQEFSVEDGGEIVVDLARAEGITNSIADVRPEIFFNPSNLDVLGENDDEPSALETEEIEAPIADMNREGDKQTTDFRIQYESSKEDHWMNPSNPEFNEIGEDLQSRQSCTVHSNPSDAVINVVAFKEVVELVNLLIEWIEIRVANSKKVSKIEFGLNSIDCFLSAHNLFVEMPRTDVEPFQEIDTVIGKPGMTERNLIFDPGISVLVIGMGYIYEMIGLFLDLKLLRNILKSFSFGGGGVIACLVEVKVDCRPEMSDAIVVVGKIFQIVSSGCWCGAERMDLYCISDCILTFDPGGVGSMGDIVADFAIIRSDSVGFHCKEAKLY